MAKCFWCHTTHHTSSWTHSEIRRLCRTLAHNSPKPTYSIYIRILYIFVQIYAASHPPLLTNNAAARTVMWVLRLVWFVGVGEATDGKVGFLYKVKRFWFNGIALGTKAFGWPYVAIAAASNECDHTATCQSVDAYVLFAANWDVIWAQWVFTK